MEKALLESNIIAVAFKQHHPEMLEALDQIQHIDVLDQIMYLAGADAKTKTGEELQGGYAKCPVEILETYQRIQPVAFKVAHNESLDENEMAIEVEYNLIAIKQTVEAKEFDQEQEYRKETETAE